MPIHVNMYESCYSETKLAPELQTPGLVTSGAAWIYGSPGATILTTTTPIKIIGIWCYMNANATYNVRIVDTAGPPNVYCTEIFHRVAVPDAGKHVCLCSQRIESGVTLKAQCADSVGASTCRVAFNYIEVS